MLFKHIDSCVLTEVIVTWACQPYVDIWAALWALLVGLIEEMLKLLSFSLKVYG